MSTRIRQIPLEKLVPHPGSPNRMSRASFEKLVRNIEQTGRYEPLVVRPCPKRHGFFQIINGRHRCEALRRLGHQTADVIVWTVDDQQTDILLATLNRLQGRDTLEKKLDLLQRLSITTAIPRLTKLLPQTRGQLERLVGARPPARAKSPKADAFAIPVVFCVDPRQEQTIEDALAHAAASLPVGQTRAAQRAAALMCLARDFLAREARTRGGGNAAAEPTVTARP